VRPLRSGVVTISVCAAGSAVTDIYMDYRASPRVRVSAHTRAGRTLVTAVLGASPCGVDNSRGRATDFARYARQRGLVVAEQQST